MSNLQPIILGTAGHIDHGKSTLIKALTGVDPDRLAEEKKRGITIELGFGEIITPSGNHFGVVDVPGHEKFVRHMVAGATGIDAALIIIAADDGVMVQTREHLAILEMLGITKALIALTKIDKSDPELIELVKADVSASLAGTPFGDAPLIAVSSVTGQGIDELFAALDMLGDEVAQSKKQAKKAPLRLPIDRVFTIGGAGTVITGTLWEGEVRPSDEVEAVFAAKTLRVRSVEVHGQAVEKAQAGNRVALNLAGISKDEVERGEMLTAPGLLEPTTRFNIMFDYRSSADFGGSNKPFKSGSRVHIHHSTRDVVAQIFLFDSKALNPGQKVFAQVRTEEPLALLARDRLIVRSFSPALTIGGGEVLQVAAAKRLKLSEHDRTLLEALAGHSQEDSIAAFMQATTMPVTSGFIARTYNWQRSEVASFLNKPLYHRIKVKDETYFIEASKHAAFAEQFEASVKLLHAAKPQQQSFSLAEIRDAMHNLCEDFVFEGWSRQVLENDALTFSEGRVSHKTSAAASAQQEEEISSRVLNRLRREGLSVSSLDELAQSESFDVKLLQKVLNKLVDSGKLVRLEAKFYFSTEAIAAARKSLENALVGTSPQDTRSAADLRTVLGVSRKYAIPLLEYFDAQGVTRREGDGRYLV